ncbi:MAG: 3-deoxy-manno-octulosonate cytidylyltransferase [Bdellovibrionota bacterium]
MGKPMIQHVWEVAAASKRVAKVLVATDDRAIVEAVEAFGGEAVMTSVDFESGSDRVAWVAAQWGAQPDSIVINLQGDEPLLAPEALDGLVQVLEENPEAQMATLAVKKQSEDDLHNPNVVKVVLDRGGEALYFSRAPLKSGPDFFFKHIGVYAFRFAALQNFCRLESSPLEKVERLEQLRALQNGFTIQVIPIAEDTVAVDVPGDVGLVEEALKLRIEGRHP